MEKQLFCYKCMRPIKSLDETCSCGFVSSTYSADPHQLQPGSLLKERYYIGKVLGEGGFGITYVGCDTLLNLKVAIKEFYMSGYVNRNNTVSGEIIASQGNSADLFSKNLKKFLGEARVLARFANEPGIVGIRDFFEENNTAYIVMDFLEGGTLKDHLKKTGRMPWRKTIETITPILNSLKNVHNENIVHRDISPDNIMLTSDGNVKLLDFGAAREISENDAKSLSVILKPGYAPEEQYRSKGKQGPWTDIYSLCATMYVCMTGTLPEESMDRIFEDSLKAPSEIEPSIDKALDAVILKGMAVRAEARYQCIEDLQAALSAVMNGTAPVPSNDAFADSNRTVVATDIKEPAGNQSTPANRGQNVIPANASQVKSTVPAQGQNAVPSKGQGTTPAKQPKDKATKEGKASGSKLIPIIIGAVVIVLIVVVLVVKTVSSGNKESATLPKTTTVLSDIRKNNVLKDSFTSGEIISTETNARGDTYTVMCKIVTADGEETVIVYYDLDEKNNKWNYSQAIVQ